jgi:hypothetical protein
VAHGHALFSENSKNGNENAHIAKAHLQNNINAERLKFVGECINPYKITF